MNTYVLTVLILAVFGVFLIIFLFFYFWRKWSKKFTSKEFQYIRSHWIRIIDMFQGNHRGAIMDADKLLDYVLGIKGYSGNLGEKLKKAKSKFSDLDGVWSAHKLRNKIAHEFAHVDKSSAKVALIQFKKALNDLGARL